MTLGNGIVSGLFVWLGFVITTLSVNYAYGQRRPMLTLIDGLHWLRRGGARVAVVNTQEHNAGALALDRALGFVSEPQGLTVLTRRLDPTAP